MNRPHFKVTCLGSRHSFIRLTDRIAIITQSLKRPGKAGRRARVISAYFGFASQSEAIAFIAGLRKYFPKAFCQSRPGQRLGTAVEVKVRAFDGLERFTWELAVKPAIVAPAVHEKDWEAQDPAGFAEMMARHQDEDGEMVTPEQAKADLFPAPVAIASNVVSFPSRAGAPLANRDRPTRFKVGSLMISID